MTIQTTVSLASLFTQLNVVIFFKEVGRISHEEYERGNSGEMEAKIAAINTHDRLLKVSYPGLPKSAHEGGSRNVDEAFPPLKKNFNRVATSHPDAYLTG